MPVGAYNKYGILYQFVFLSTAIDCYTANLKQEFDKYIKFEHHPVISIVMPLIQ